MGLNGGPLALILMDGLGSTFVPIFGDLGASVSPKNAKSSGVAIEVGERSGKYVIVWNVKFWISSHSFFFYHIVLVFFVNSFVVVLGFHVQDMVLVAHLRVLRCSIEIFLFLLIHFVV